MEDYPDQLHDQALTDQQARDETRRNQVVRLVRLGKDFRRAVSDLPDGQQYIDEQAAVRKTVGHHTSEIEGRY